MPSACRFRPACGSACSALEPASPARVPVGRVYILGNADALDRNVDASVSVEARDARNGREHERKSRLPLGDEGSSLGTLNPTGRWLLSWTTRSSRSPRERARGGPS
jgi:hypothetical protein